ncbi:MAG: hypothetical protein ABI427_08910 [Solirubrobacteraceae bacterium]
MAYYSIDPRPSYSERHGRGPRAQPLPFETVRRLVVSVLDNLWERAFFQEAFGYECVDAGIVDGTLGADPGAYFVRAILREGVWPYKRHWQDQDPSPPPWESWDADTMFDVLEVLHDLVSEPVNGSHHDYNDCGWHYSTFNRASGQIAFRREMNSVLRLGEPSYEFDDLGQVIETGPVEFRTLLNAPVPEGTEHDLITRKIDAAVSRFQTRGASIEDRQHAVRDLADVLEALRDDIKATMLPADEKALFHLANGFAIRHNNRQQRGDYDRATWLSWAFYSYLATIHAVLRVRIRQHEQASN